TKLEKKMNTVAWRPDFGPTIPHPSAGVSVIGARRPLIAFNVQLSTDDLEVAEQIAKAVREISGGLPAVRAIPIRLAERGIVQVSMNLLDYERTSIFTAFDAVRREATARGVEVLSSELIGLAPAEALLVAAAESLVLENFSMNLVIENQLDWT
ncbi:MAG: glutamate formiminotransferase, partial [Acidobacteria bacterium]|nr:glutamate formiminotransferase [Acidobacteriota bacterium]